MAQMTPTKHTINEFNGGTGNEYGQQVFPVSDLTKMVENSAYATQTAETAYEEAHSAFTGNGTLVYENNVLQPTFNADKKAEGDASNLSSANVTSWKAQLDIDDAETTITKLSNTENNVDLNNCSSVQAVIDAMYAGKPNPIGYGSCGTLDDTNFKGIVGNPSGFGNYTKTYAKIVAEANGFNKLIELHAFSLYGNAHAMGYMSTDNAGGYYWSGWKVW